MIKKIILLFVLIIHAIFADCQSGINNPLIVGHRGGFDASLPENSIAMFDFTFHNACRQPIAVEFDIRESATGSLYLMHDSTVDRTTNGSGKINLLPDSYIKTLFLKDRNGETTKEKIPLFADVLQHFKDKNIILMLDVKGKIYQKVISQVSDMKMESKCILLTFNQSNTKLVKENTSEILISALVITKEDWESLNELQIPVKQLIAYVSNETPPELISEICRNKVRVMTDMSEGIYNNSKPYDPDYYREVLEKIHLGIIISDYPVVVNRLFCGK
jgi:glycerophosphoryl diester phosphodiesterase